MYRSALRPLDQRAEWQQLTAPRFVVAGSLGSCAVTNSCGTQPPWCRAILHVAKGPSAAARNPAHRPVSANSFDQLTGIDWGASPSRINDGWRGYGEGDHPVTGMMAITNRGASYAVLIIRRCATRPRRRFVQLFMHLGCYLLAERLGEPKKRPSRRAARPFEFALEAPLDEGGFRAF